MLFDFSCPTNSKSMSDERSEEGVDLKKMERAMRVELTTSTLAR